MAPYTPNTNRTTATVAPGKIFSQTEQGVLVQYVGGDTVTVHKEDYIRFKREGILL